MTATMTEKTTESVLIEMLTENTGRALCDSGGIPQYDANGKYVGSSQGYGRRFEINAGRDFVGEADAVVNVSKHGIELTVRTYHWLKSKLDYNAELDEEFYAFAGRPENESEPWLTVMQAFAAELAETRTVTGLYGDDDPMVIYTYNHENNLDQDVQFLYFELDGEPHVLLQTHNGCDARGGMTAPHAFSLDEHDGADILSFATGSIACAENHDHYWITDDGHHFYAEGACGHNAGQQLEEYELEELELPEDMETAVVQVAAQLQDEKKLYHTSDGIGFCPICGGVLVGSRF